MAKTPEQVVDELAKNSKPDDLSKVDGQFAAKLQRLRDDDHGSDEMIEQLEEMWAMLNAPDEVVPWKAKALIMAALSYFVSPLDMIPDVVGKAGYFDDAAVVRIVRGRIEVHIEAFRAAK